MRFFTRCNFITLLLLGLPCFGLLLALMGLLQGPNYFGPRIIVIDSARSETTTAQGGRFGSPSTSTTLHLTYHYTDRHSAIRHGSTSVVPDKIPQENRAPGSQVFLTIPVDKEEGSFAINHNIELGLSLTLVFGLMGLPGVAQVRWRNQPETKRTWYLWGLVTLGLIGVVLL